MGCIIVFAIQKFIENMPLAGSYWAFSGGILYITGSVFYLLKKLPFNHAIFHVFVLLGSLCHFVTIYFFVLAP